MIWCLHGFLGRGADWDRLRAACHRAHLPAVRAPDLFAPGAPLSPGGESLAEWGDRFAEHVATRDWEPILVGYSLGARLALHALLARPRMWRAAVIVSAHPGLSGAAERAARRAHDERWARRVARDPWEALLRRWNAQRVFGGSAAPGPRPESAFDRCALAAALRDWSLGAQAPLNGRLTEVRCPVTWVVGERDVRYLALARDAVAALAAGTLHVAPGAGHRVPWEAAGWFSTSIAEVVRQRH